MRNLKRIDRILKLIRKIWRKNPDLRLGQLLLIAIKEKNVFYTEDKDLEKRLKEEYRKYLRKEEKK